MISHNTSRANIFIDWTRYRVYYDIQVLNKLPLNKEMIIKLEVVTQGDIFGWQYLYILLIYTNVISVCLFVCLPYPPCEGAESPKILDKAQKVGQMPTNRPAWFFVYIYFIYLNNAEQIESLTVPNIESTWISKFLII